VGLAIQCSTSIIYPMLPLFVETLGEHGGLVASTSGLILGVSALAGALSALLAGRLGGRHGYATVLQVCVAGGFVFSLPQALVTHPAQLLVLRTLSSAFLGGALPMVSAIVATRVERDRQGGVFGWSMALNSAGAAIGPAAGSALAAGFGYASVFVGGGAMMLATSLAMALGLRRHRRKTAAPEPPPGPGLTSGGDDRPAGGPGRIPGS
jgi:MFS family permease